MLLLDQGLPRSATRYLREAGIPAVHAGEVGLSSASDEAILDYARSQKLIVVTLDADFHRKLVLSDATGPSVIRVRIEGLRAEKLAQLLLGTIEKCREDLDRGAMVSVTEAGVKLRHLPLLR